MAQPGKKPKKRRIVGGVDTHAETHHAAVVLMNGGRIADAEFPTTPAGERQLLDWLRSFGRLNAVGVEGTGSYGTGLTRHLRGEKVPVIEVDRPDRSARRKQGKSDALDAYAAADAVLSGRATTVPKSGDGIVESIRALHTARAGAIKARTCCMNELRALIVTAPGELREQLRGLKATALVTTCMRLRPTTGELADPIQGVKHTLRSLARRHQHLNAEITDLDTQLAPLVAAANPGLLAKHGFGVETAAQLLITAGDNPDRLASEAGFAALCGAAPVPASSGQNTRYRLNRGGDRQANRALYAITITRMATCPKTRAYVRKRTAEGKSKRDIIRCLKRYIAREAYYQITNPQLSA